MTAADDVWAAVSTPFENLRTDAEQRPEVSWPDRRATLYVELSAVAESTVADRLLAWLDDLPEDERATLLVSDELAARAYEVVVQTVPEPVQEEQAQEYDADAWFAFLTENGARWDGTDESWQEFRDWFLYYATEGGFGDPAGLLLDYLDPRSPAERVALLAEYGVVIAAPEQATVAALDPEAQRIMAELLAERPEYAEIPEARRVELLAAVMARKETQS
jgi:hypothetical protein